MSLLLDALKKAEQSKREKAAEVAGDHRGPSGQPQGGTLEPDSDFGGFELELQLEPLPEERPSAGASGVAAGGAPEAEVGSGWADPSPGLGEAAGSSTLRLGPESGVASGPLVATGELDLEEFARKLSEAGPPTIETGALGVSELREGSVTAAQTMPSLKNVQAALREFYGESTGVGPAAGSAVPSSQASGATSTIESQASQRAARNVFEAKEVPARKRRKALVPLGVTAVVLTALLVGGYYAMRSFTTVRPSILAVSRPAPIPVAPVPAPAPAAPAPAAPAPDPAAPTVVAEAPAISEPPAASAPAAAPAPEAVPAMPPGPATGPAPEAPSVAAAAPAPAPAAAPAVASAAPAPQAAPAAPAVAPVVATAPVPETAPARPATRGLRPSDEEAYRLALASPPPARAQPPGVAQPAPVAASSPEPAPAAAESAPVVRAQPSSPRPRASSPVRVMSRSEPDPTYVRLDRAYQAFQSGDYEQARELYRQVLARDPRNRDALLGMGAIATARGESQQAQTIYRRVLSQNPGDRVATAAIGNLGASVGVAVPEGEARLKQALAQDPGASYLHFSLGNLYASQRRWSEAQQAYFNAYRTDSRNADYAFNLAVSLDRLGKPRQALEFYRRALETAETAGRQSAFSAEAVRTRIQILEATGSHEGS